MRDWQWWHLASYTFSSVRALVAQIADYINSWNANPRPFTWIATADEILAKVKVVEANVASWLTTTPSKASTITGH